MRAVPVDELRAHVGTEIGSSDWFPIDQDRVNGFADVTADHQWIHVDEAAAAKGPFGTTIAHGFLTLSLVTPLMGGISMYPEGTTTLINYGSNKVRFLAPVRVGSRIRAVATLTDVAEKAPGRYLLTTNVVIEIEGEDTPALVAEILTMAIVAQA